MTIYRHGDGTLAVDCARRPGVAKGLAELGLAIHQAGDEESTAIFAVERFTTWPPWSSQEKGVC